MPSIKDVAAKANVSVATVSRVFSNGPHVRAEVREHVLKVADELGYRPNRIARSLRKLTSHVIGVMVSDVRNPFFVEVARAIEDVANSQGVSVFLCNTDENPEKEQTYLRTLLDEMVAGIILVPTQEKVQNFGVLLERTTPIVTIDRRIEGATVDSVLSDNVHSAYQLTSHLIKQGYKRIGAVIGLEHSTTGRERLRGFKLALEEHGLEFDPEFVSYVSPTEDGSEPVVDQWLESPNRPQAIFSGNGLITMGVINAAYKAGVSIPQGIALAGFDDAIWMRHVGGGITVISQPVYEMGRTAAELLFQRQADPTRAPREVVLKGKLIERGSTVLIR
jgi:LacI family transcriptional regulator, fructose operon transcriptional repressor